MPFCTVEEETVEQIHLHRKSSSRCRNPDGAEAVEQRSPMRIQDCRRPESGPRIAPNGLNGLPELTVGRTPTDPRSRPASQPGDLGVKWVEPADVGPVNCRIDPLKRIKGPRFTKRLLRTPAQETVALSS